jgi:hypothetical protein
MERVQLLKTLMSNLEKDEGVKKSPNISIKLSKALNVSKEDRKIIRDFCGMCSKLLELEDQYDCFLESDRKISKKLVAGDFGLPDLAVPFPGFFPGSGAASVPSDFSLFAFKAIGSIGLFCNVQNSLHTYMKKALE